MIDLHTHVLPGIDDGASDLDQAVAICRAAAHDGCNVLVATPHQRHPAWWNSDEQHLDRLRRRLQAELGTHPRILLGAEVHADSQLLDAVLDATGPAPSRLAGTRYLLLELSRDGIGPDPEMLVHELSVAGIVPVLAHPEHIPWLRRDPQQIERLVDLGALLQVTASSVLGRHGRAVQSSAHDLLDQGLVHVLASDCHGLRSRPPGLARARDFVAEHWGSNVAEALTNHNPRAIVEDRQLSRAA